MSEGTQRRLAAIVSADVVGYSRLMGADEAGTLAAMRAHRAELWNPMIEQFGGRVVGTAGDSILVEFASAVAAVESAVAVQRGMIERNADVPEERQMLLRIGVNIGEVVIDGDDIFGDGVNVAARLQAIADSGGIAISGNVHEQVNGKLDVVFSDDGEHEVKNIDRPVHIWRWAPDAKVTPRSAATADQPLALPDKPSIAVLPFDNMSGDPEQEYFSDGITEDIITALSRFHQFFVIARNSSFTYKGSAVDVKQVAQELGVQYVIEGSVRRAGNRVRITAQLIDAPSDHHIWAERYDRELDDIFAVQDEITERIAWAVAPELDAVQMEAVRHKNVQELGAWELVARAREYLASMSKENNGAIQTLLTEALTHYPNNARIHAILARSYVGDSLFGWRRSVSESRAIGLELAQKSVDLDRDDEYCQAALGILQLWSGQHDKSVQRLKTGIKINPNDSNALGNLGITLVYLHKHEEALEYLNKAIRLSPKDRGIAHYLFHIGVHHFIEKRYDEAVTWGEKALHEFPSHPGVTRLLTAANGMLGNQEAARAACERLLELAPGMTIAWTREAVPWAFDDDADHYSEGLRRAGLPEK
jgi:TolB-like protein/Flp pilus assembly protein TadD